MSRIKFREGEQRKFLIEVLKKLNCPTLRAFNQFGFEIPYSTWKNYFSEARLLPEELFNQICFLSKVEKYQYIVECSGRRLRELIIILNNLNWVISYKIE